MSSFVRPELADLVDRAQQDLVSGMELTPAGGTEPSPVLRRSVVQILARVLGGSVHMLHGHLVFLAEQVLPDQAEAEYLARWADIYSVARRAAAFAEGTVTITGTNGTVITAGTTLIRSDGAEYLTDAEVTIAAGTATAAVTAVVAGADGTLEVGVELSFESPVAGAEETVTVATSTQDGSDEEDDDALRARLLERIREPPHGGSESDYPAWAKEVAGVTRAWVYPQELGSGTVTVRFVRDDDAGSIIPSAGEVEAVQEHIDDPTRRPVTATVTVVAPVGVELDFELEITPDTAATRAAVTAELTDLLRRVAEPGGTLLLSQLRGAVGGAEGVTDYVMTSPVADVPHATGELAIMGTITWT